MGLVTLFSTVRGYTSVAILDPVTLQALMKQINSNLEDSYSRKGEIKSGPKKIGHILKCTFNKKSTIFAPSL